MLQAARRIDWRFLLPSPELGSVACLGPCDVPLIDALARFGDSVTLFDGAGGAAPEGDLSTHDLAVLRDPTVELLGRAAQLVRPGGWVYAEVHGPLARAGRGGRRPRFAVACARVLEELGFEQVAVHWHWPAFASCSEIVPLADRAAVRHALGRRRSSLGARLKAVVGALLLAGGLLPYLVPCASVVARRPAGGREGAG